MDIDEIDFSGVKSGSFVSDFIQPHDGSSLPGEAVQPNGVDLSIGELYRLSGESYISNDSYEKANRIPVNLQEEEIYHVTPDEAYIIVYDEKITIPENHIGLVLPRSRLMRCGLQVETAVWDSGYSGVGEGQLVVNSPARFDENLRCAQIVFIPTENLDSHYEGSHQNERLD